MSMKRTVNKVRNIMVGTALATFGLGCAKDAPQTPELNERWSDESLWSLEVVDIDGNTRSLADYQGKVALVVNVASRCGFTSQYEELQALFEQRSDSDFVILGFPCNDFGSQESGTESEIKSFCSTRYGVEFPMFEKVQITSDEDRSPVYMLLGTQTGKLPGWNFSKYVVGRDGRAIEFFSSTVTPSSPKIQSVIDEAMKQPAPAV